jgi:hypothetical protein
VNVRRRKIEENNEDAIFSKIASVVEYCERKVGEGNYLAQNCTYASTGIRRALHAKRS